MVSSFTFGLEYRGLVRLRVGYVSWKKMKAGKLGNKVRQSLTRRAADIGGCCRLEKKSMISQREGLNILRESASTSNTRQNRRKS